MTVVAMPRGFRVSLREFLLLFTAIFFGCAALKYANDWWTTTTQT